MYKNFASDVRQDPLSIYGIYRGVVEDRKDPEMLGRCKVRIVGLHSTSNQKNVYDGIPTDELPWAEPALSLFEGSVSDMGLWSVPLQGSMVSVYFENGNILRPVYFASLPGLPISQDPLSETPLNEQAGTSYPPTYSDPESPGNEDYEAPQNLPPGTVIDVTITRGSTSDEKGTIGELVTSGGFRCKTLELPWLDNRSSISCIKAGTYKCTIHTKADSKHRGRYLINATPGRAGCLIHAGGKAGDKTKGYKADSAGCILLVKNITTRVCGGPGPQYYSNYAESQKVIADFENHLARQPFTLTVK